MTFEIDNTDEWTPYDYRIGLLNERIEEEGPITDVERLHEIAIEIDRLEEQIGYLERERDGDADKEDIEKWQGEITCLELLREVFLTEQENQQ